MGKYTHLTHGSQCKSFKFKGLTIQNMPILLGHSVCLKNILQLKFNNNNRILANLQFWKYLQVYLLSF